MCVHTPADCKERGLPGGDDDDDDDDNDASSEDLGAWDAPSRVGADVDDKEEEGEGGDEDEATAGEMGADSPLSPCNYDTMTKDDSLQKMNESPQTWGLLKERGQDYAEDSSGEGKKQVEMDTADEIEDDDIDDIFSTCVQTPQKMKKSLKLRHAIQAVDADRRRR